MPRKTDTKKTKNSLLEQKKAEALLKKKKVKDEITAVVIIAIGLFLILSMFTGTTGAVGAAVKAFFAGLFGWVSYILPFFLLIYGILVFAQKTSLVTGRSVIAGAILIILITCFVANLKTPLKEVVKYDFSMPIKTIYSLGTESGGIIGVYAGGFIKNLIGEMGLYLICLAGVIISLLLILNTPLSTLFDNARIRRKAHKEAKLEARLEEEKLEEAAREREAEVRKLEEQKALKQAREEEQAKAERQSKQKALTVENDQIKVDADKLPKLDMKAVQSFDSDNSASAESKDSSSDFLKKYEDIAPSDPVPGDPDPGLALRPLGTSDLVLLLPARVPGRKPDLDEYARSPRTGKEMTHGQP